MYAKTTTKDIKRALRSRFSHAFSVTKGRGTASHWVSISWTDGVTENAVREFCLQFNDTANDDTMTDLWCGSQYTSENRNLSDKYCWLLVNELDLRTPPTIKEQMENYFNLLWRRSYSPKMLEKNGTFVIESTLDQVEHVKESLEKQGCQVEITDNRLTVNT